MKTFIDSLDRQFVDLYTISRQIIEKTPSEKLFWKPIEIYSIFSIGEYILRSSGKVEQTFGGITTRLWDDPFEWTLPEELSSKEKIFEYLEEVEATRKNGFKFLDSDEILRKEIPAPDEFKSLFELLIETLAEAQNLQGRAFSILQMLEKK